TGQPLLDHERACRPIRGAVTAWRAPSCGWAPVRPDRGLRRRASALDRAALLALADQRLEPVRDRAAHLPPVTQLRRVRRVILVTWHLDVIHLRLEAPDQVFLDDPALGLR